MKILFALFLILHVPCLHAQKSGADSGVDSILQVRRIYVSPLTGGMAADALRDLIISSLNNTKLFILTDNADRADAILKGAADDKTFTDTFDSTEGVSGHENGSKSTGGSTLYSRAAGIAVGDGGSLDESHHIKERKHEAYAAVRLCNKDGDVLWSTTQESLGGKFKGAAADVAARIAHQITLDYARERRLADGTNPPPPAATVVPVITVK
jgi:hypothetical protein